MKKLIEVALPLEAINTASAREKSIRHGHPSTLHLWWARRPLAAARAVIFSQMVDDPSEYVDELLADAATRAKAERAHKSQLKAWETRKATFEKAQAAGMPASSNPDPGPQPTLEGVIAQIERERLFTIIEELVLWENTTNEKVLQAARDEIWRSWRRTCAQYYASKGEAMSSPPSPLYDPEKLPAFHDPFAGGGALPLEAQRLGLESYASDLNPVAVLINKAMIEIPPKFAGQAPVNPKSRQEMRLMKREWKGAQGLAEDVRYYGQWMRDEAEKRIGHLYPKVEITAEMAQERPDLKKYVGQKLTVIAWIWVRTVKSPNPAFSNVDVPLASTFMLATKPGKQAYVEPVIENNSYRFTVNVGKPKDINMTENGTKLARANFVCLMSGVPISGDYIKAEGKSGRIGTRLMAIVAEGERGRVYLSPTDTIEKIAHSATPEWKPDLVISGSTQYLGNKLYGMEQFSQIYTDRQLVALTTFSDLVLEARKLVIQDVLKSKEWDKLISHEEDDLSLASNGVGATAYADAISIYLSFAIDRMAMTGNSLVRWNSVGEKAQHCFGRQALPMLWDFAEPNFFAGATGSMDAAIFYSSDPLNWMHPIAPGFSKQDDAASQLITNMKLVSTDPPYYDNVPYADLSDFFYVWLRRSMKLIFPDIFSTLAVPKSEELVAFAHRHESKVSAETFFLHGMTQAMNRLAEQSHPAFPVTIYYAFKQTENDGIDGTASTGWETFLA